MWACVEQLLLNKSIQNKVKQNKRNLITTCLDCQKVFDSIPHDWMIFISEKLIIARETLTKI